MTGSARRTRHRPSQFPHLPYGYDDDMPYQHDPLNPHPEHPTPIELVLRLPLPQRKERVRALIALSQRKYAEAIAEISAKKTSVAICALVSGGNDSYGVAHLFRDVTTHHVHANTGTGIEATREFVRSTAADWGIPLIEHGPKPGTGYFDLVRGNVMARSRETGELVQAWPGGFPGPAAHAVMYQRLKERAFAQVPHDFDISGSRTECVVFIAGRRRAESKRRATIPYLDIDGTIAWISPFAVWHKADLLVYRIMFPDVPQNPVARVLGMSGECGCLSYAVAGETERWRVAYPDEPFILMVSEVEAELADRDDIPEHRKKWGWVAECDDPDEVEEFARNAMCSVNCGPDPLFDSMDPLFDLDQEWLAS
jgi:3'-phosphoadenosine 5'-phosphosulfate sulfotransferase (PAPS reductase)/FAD synthetase